MHSCAATIAIINSQGPWRARNEFRRGSFDPVAVCNCAGAASCQAGPVRPAPPMDAKVDRCRPQPTRAATCSLHLSRARQYVPPADRRCCLSSPVLGCPLGVPFGSLRYVLKLSETQVSLLFSLSILSEATCLCLLVSGFLSLAGFLSHTASLAVAFNVTHHAPFPIPLCRGRHARRPDTSVWQLTTEWQIQLRRNCCD